MSESKSLLPKYSITSLERAIKDDYNAKKAAVQTASLTKTADEGNSLSQSSTFTSNEKTKDKSLSTQRPLPRKKVHSYSSAKGVVGGISEDASSIELSKSQYYSYHAENPSGSRDSCNHEEEFNLIEDHDHIDVKRKDHFSNESVFSKSYYDFSSDNIKEPSSYNMFAAFLFFSFVICAIVLFAVYEVVFTNPNNSNLPPFVGASVNLDEFFDNKPLPSFKVITKDSNRKDNYFVVDDHDSSIVYTSGRYTKNYDSAGWNYLSINALYGNGIKTPTSSFNIEDMHDAEASYHYFVAMKAAGYFEGFTTCVEIKYWYSNFYSGLFDGGDPKKPEYDYIIRNHEWMVQNANSYWKTSKYWFTVRGLLYQLDGMIEGSRAGCPVVNAHGGMNDNGNILMSSMERGFALHHFLLMNANGDLYQIAEKYDQESATAHRNSNDDIDANEENVNDTGDFPTDNPILGNIDPKVLKKKHRDHCSAIIKVLDDNSDIVFGHNTWDDYQCAYPRIFKHYSLPFVKLSTHKTDDIDVVKEIFNEVSDLNNADVTNGDGSGNNKLFVSTTNTYFSSSPGLLSSVDDFFIVRGVGNLAVTETTIDVYNDDLYKFIYPETMLSWMRARIANHLSVSGEKWAQWFAHKSSGTYVNQWMAMDLNKFKPGNEPEDGFLTVLEEIPGNVHFSDMTHKLRDTSYWASYNNPFFSDINELSGNANLCKNNVDSCYETDPRALIFKARQHTVKDIPTLQSLLGYNNFKVDVYSKNDSCNAISCRMDLEPEHRYQYPFGALDAKISSVQSVMSVPTPTIYARLGPTHDTLQPFCWNKFEYIRNIRGLPLVHMGHPDCLDFSWTQFPPPE